MEFDTYDKAIPLWMAGGGLGDDTSRPVDMDRLSDVELLAAALQMERDDSSAHIAERVLKAADEGRTIDEELLVNAGIARMQARRLTAALTLCRRLECRGKDRVVRLDRPAAVHRELRHLATRTQERFIVLSLDGGLGLLGMEVVSLGTANSVMVHPRDVFASALERRATHLILAHNHPTGLLEPSDDDITMTRRMEKAGKLLGVNVLDHIVFDSEGWYSMVEHGILK